MRKGIALVVLLGAAASFGGCEKRGAKDLEQGNLAFKNKDFDLAIRCYS